MPEGGSAAPADAVTAGAAASGCTVPDGGSGAPPEAPALTGVAGIAAFADAAGATDEAADGDAALTATDEGGEAEGGGRRASPPVAGVEELAAAAGAAGVTLGSSLISAMPPIAAAGLDATGLGRIVDLPRISIDAPLMPGVSSSSPSLDLVDGPESLARPAADRAA